MDIATLLPWLQLLGTSALVLILLLRQPRHMGSMVKAGLDDLLGRIQRSIRDETIALRREHAIDLATLREDLAQRLDQFAQRLTQESRLSRTELRDIGELSRNSLESQMQRLSQETGQRLEEIRRTVSDKLEGTLEKRLGESFRIVSDRLEQVHKGLGEMQNLAVGVGDLKKVLTNVKTRGTWGEIQLGSLLEQVLAPEQFERNVLTKRQGHERVEFALKLPGRDLSDRGSVWLPIDAKFPVENYYRLVDAQEKGDTSGAEIEAKQLENYIKICGRDISDKYLSPPDTTDFGVMYLPTESLFAEVARRVGLIEYLQRECRVIVAGPTTLAALLNSLQMGFRTLAIQKRSSEVWEILGAVKNEFGKFEDVLRKVEKKLQEAGNVIESVNQRSRVIQKKLRGVQALAPAETQSLLTPTLIGITEASDLDDA